MYTTINQIRACGPCGLDPRKLPLTGYQLLVSRLGADFDPDAPVAISYILESNGLDDALWCLQSVKGHDRDIRLLAVDFARSVEHLSDDQCVKHCNDITERFANGLATAKELAAAAARAAAAAGEAAAAAGEAARAARAAAGEAAGEAARAAAGAATWATWAAARAATNEATWAAAGEAGLAAWEIQSNLLAAVCAEIEQRS